MRLFLVGYMCSGKTTLGKYLANKLSYAFVDLDEYIEESENMSVSDIFKEAGESTFRKIENKYLRDLCLMDNIVIATGGGTPCNNNNMSLINSSGVSVYIQTSPVVLIDRLLVMGKNRPIVAGKNLAELDEFVRNHLKGREPFYQKANIRINGDVWDVERIARELIQNLETTT